MPWLLGDPDQARLVEAAEPNSFALSGLLETRPLYLGYLLTGFTRLGEVPRFRPERVPLAMRAGWIAVAPAARTDDPLLARHLGPFLAPTAARPHRQAPLGFALFSSEWLRQRLGAALEESMPELRWAGRLSFLLSEQCPVFCDPVLELDLRGRTSAEAAACTYRAVPAWVGALAALKEQGR